MSASTSPPQIRSCTTDDIPAIQTIAQATWPVAYYPHILGTEQLAYMLDLLYSTGALHTAMTEKDQRFLLLETTAGPTGFASYTPNYRSAHITHLNKLYVLPSAQGTGAGIALLDRVIAEARDLGTRSIELNVNKRNPAVAFYQHRGFRIKRDEVIDIGQGYVMDDHVMELAL
ncbi:MAG: GNAT family N-acetyltransferase [Flavobacteriales bacterium]|nr:GNAT family N-acetyltransferase [Flavobacteriales bacterium]